MPFHFADPYDPRIPEFEKIAAPTSYAPAMLRLFANQAYGGFDAEAGLSSIRQPVLVLAGRHDRTCSVEAAETIARGVPKSELVIFERSGHLPFVEEQELYIEAVRNFSTAIRRDHHEGNGWGSSVQATILALTAWSAR
jgi:proline iminopeptidase